MDITPEYWKSHQQKINLRFRQHWKIWIKKIAIVC